MSEKIKKKGIRPRAITMWDFSWLERRWPGAGYEDWDKALDELKERGYDAVRIDAYPHLVAENPQNTWTLHEVWNTQNWGSPDIIKVQIQPSLNQFISKCKDRDIKVGLSTWFRKDEDKTLMKINSAEKMADIWIKTISTLAEENLLDAILYVDLCNEWPGDLWCPFFKNEAPELSWGYWHELLRDEIEVIAAGANKANLPLITTECWGIVDFKDWPGLNWEIVKEMCALGVKEAAATGQWIAIASSNFVGPQFVGMWSDIDYHQKLTDIIKSSHIQSSLLEKGITNRLI